MIKKITLLSISAVSFFLLNSYVSGAPSNGATGSPGDGNKTCARSGCHSGTATAVSNMFTSDIPSTGWEAGKTYNITFTVSESGISTFGFQVTAEDATGSSKGNFVATSATKIQDNASHITHLRGSTTSMDSKAWTFTWQAPAKGTGKVTFYGSGNAANGDRRTSGDLIKTSSMAVEENTSTSIANFKNTDEVKVFPIPAFSVLNVHGVKNGSFKIFDLAGYTHMQGNFTAGDNELNISSLENGVYFLVSENSELAQKIVIQ